MKQLWSFVRLSRSHFLLGGFLLFAVGAAATDDIDATHYLVAQLMVTAIQITAHYVNEYADVVPDRLVVNRTLFSGGSGVLAARLLHPSVALQAAAASSAVAVGAAVVVATFSLPAAAIGCGALAVSWSYSMPPLRLVGSGWGELGTTFVVAGGVPLVGSLAQGGTPPVAVWWSIAVLMPIHLAMVLSFELPDVDTDAAAGKRVLAVRLGRRDTGRLIRLSLAAAAAVAVAGGVGGGIPAPAAWTTLTGVVPAAVVVLAMRRNRYSVLTAAAVATLGLVAAGLVLGLRL
jgi:1,4-dihydroxy-2-naphthoate octaprenyltransferase